MRDKASDHFDALIDDTARAMTAGTPPASLRSAIRERIDRSTHSRFVWQMGLAAASVALAALFAGRALLDTPAPPARLGSAFVAATVPPAPRIAVLAPRLPDTAPAPMAIDRPVAGEPRPLPPALPIVVQPIVLEPLSAAPPVEIEVMEVPMPLRAESVEIERLVFE